VPIIADIDAGFGNAEATYLLAKKMIEAGACAIQIENQVSDEKQCGHQDGKVTVPHEDFLAKIRAVRYAFLELGVEDGIIVARTDSLGAGLTKQIAVTHEIGDIGDKYNNFLDGDYIESATISPTVTWSSSREGKLLGPSVRPSNLPVLLQGRHRRRPRGAGLYHLAAERRGPAVDRDREAARRPDRRDGQPYPRSRAECQAGVQQLAVLQLDPELPPAGVRCLERRGQGRLGLRSRQLMSVEYDDSELAAEADARIRTFQADASREAGIFHHLITLPTYHTAALSTDNLAREYFGDAGMLGYVKNVQRQEIRQGIACVKHQNMAGSDMGDDHKEYFAGDAALKAGGADNTMNQFG
jgi:isocitrate lyase